MILVAITGTLSIPRKEGAAQIDTTQNARFYSDVTYDTNYLVAARFDSGKANVRSTASSALEGSLDE